MEKTKNEVNRQWIVFGFFVGGTNDRCSAAVRREREDRLAITPIGDRG
jgi:hypothetical protein